MERTRYVRRTAAKSHECDDVNSTDCRPIAKGDVYLQLTALPREHESATEAGRPLTMVQCAACARVSGNEQALAPSRA
jgi:hypothetical protein